MSPEPTEPESAYGTVVLIDIPIALVMLSKVAPCLFICLAATAINTPPDKAPLMMIGCGFCRMYVCILLTNETPDSWYELDNMHGQWDEEFDPLLQAEPQTRVSIDITKLPKVGRTGAGRYPTSCQSEEVCPTKAEPHHDHIRNSAMTRCC